LAAFGGFENVTVDSSNTILTLHDNTSVSVTWAPAPIRQRRQRRQHGDAEYGDDTVSFTGARTP